MRLFCFTLFSAPPGHRFLCHCFVDGDPLDDIENDSTSDEDDEDDDDDDDIVFGVEPARHSGSSKHTSSSCIPVHG